VFLNEKGVPVKEESFDARNEEFQLWDIPFENYAHQDPVIAAFEMVSMGGGGPRMQVEFESIEIWAEGGYQDYQPP
jgi:hypothetical protein